MPDIGYYHPIIVHFAVALLVAGVLFRLVSLTGRARFTGPAATSLILVGTVFALAAVHSGSDAHGPAERIPGAHDAVEEHEESGEQARNIFVAVALLELGALYLARKHKEKMVLVASAMVGLVGLFFLYEAGEHGGELVYTYAGGVGTRSGDEQDVEQLLLAGIYHQTQLDRANGRHSDAAALVNLALGRHPQDPEIQLLGAESMLLDQKDPEAALEALGTIRVPEENRRLRFRLVFLEADAFEASGDAEGARSRLEALQADFPDSGRIQRRLEAIH